MNDLFYARFRRFAEEIARERRTSLEAALDPIGLMLRSEGTNFDYWCTPTNTITVAATGGDGVHFGLLVDPSGASPVVMTVPMTDDPNLVVAPDFHSFLRLGYHAGFFLEQFVYDWNAAVAIHGREGDGWGDRERRLIEKLRARFELAPVPDVGTQIRHAHETYGHRLVLPNREDWDRRHGL